ncbi:hypothetical protein FRB90_007537 [Tulasnella sp. 427]|nr:hypothetical protein FRB90_007537 [Tulasnella sp. 427]
MRFSVAATFLATSFAGALTILQRQTVVPDITACAQTCLTGTDGSPCNSTDTACLCVNMNYITALSTCIGKSCTADEAQTAQAAGIATCQAAGIDLTNPVPACALTCESQAPVGTCAAKDGKCLCQNTEYLNSLKSCVSTACTGPDIETASVVGEALCRAYGVDVSSIIGA